MDKKDREKWSPGGKTMVKVFLVEDEAIIRRGIRDNIDWASHGFEFAGEAGDGEYAYPLILKAQPDILVTDIKMPFMDGLELSRLVKKTLPRTRIIVLSGYNEFEYAKEAIKIGISDYLLKPVSSAGLIDALKKAADEIREEREKSRLLERYFVSYEKYTEFLDKTDYSGVDRKLINDFLKLGSVEECSPFVEEYFAAIGEHNYKSLLLRQYMTMDIFYCVQEFLKKLKAEPPEVSESVVDIKRVPKVIESVEMTKAYLIEEFTAALQARDRALWQRDPGCKGIYPGKFQPERPVAEPDCRAHWRQSELFQLDFQAGDGAVLCGVSDAGADGTGV